MNEAPVNPAEGLGVGVIDKDSIQSGQEFVARRAGDRPLFGQPLPRFENLLDDEIKRLDEGMVRLNAAQCVETGAQFQFDLFPGRETAGFAFRGRSGARSRRRLGSRFPLREGFPSFWFRRRGNPLFVLCRLFTERCRARRRMPLGKAVRSERAGGEPDIRLGCTGRRGGRFAVR